MPRNVVNIDEIEEFVAHLERRTAFEPVRDWLRSTYRKWLINHGPAAEEIVITPPDVSWTTAPLLVRAVQTGRLGVYAGPVPAWLGPALDRGDQVIRVECSLEAERDAWLVVDWLNAQRHQPVFRRLDRISYPQALDATRLWHAALAAQMTVEEWAGDAELEQQFGDGYRIVRLKTPRALEIEGTRMGHCVGAYDDDLRRGTVILSLRDPQNRPHCTMELIGQKVFQVKGKQNRPPVAKYRPYIRQFVALRHLEIVDDIDNVGPLLYADGRLCRDVNEYVRIMSSQIGWRLWERRPSYPFDNWVTVAPLRMVVRLRDELDDDAREMLYRSLAQGFESGIRLRPAATLNVFGTEFRYVFADYPFALTYLRAGRRVSRRRLQPAHQRGDRTGARRADAGTRTASRLAFRGQDPRVPLARGQPGELRPADRKPHGFSPRPASPARNAAAEDGGDPATSPRDAAGRDHPGRRSGPLAARVAGRPDRARGAIPRIPLKAGGRPGPGPGRPPIVRGRTSPLTPGPGLGIILWPCVAVEEKRR